MLYSTVLPQINTFNGPTNKPVSRELSFNSIINKYKDNTVKLTQQSFHLLFTELRNMYSLYVSSGEVLTQPDNNFIYSEIIDCIPQFKEIELSEEFIDVLQNYYDRINDKAVYFKNRLKYNEGYTSPHEIEKYNEELEEIKYKMSNHNSPLYNKMTELEDELDDMYIDAYER